jgi:parvulin-like peptidyl-prolyl isomerase
MPSNAGIVRTFRSRGTAALAAAVLLLVPASPPRARNVDEIVAWVNDDIITRSDVEDREKETVQELYGRLSGTELDKRLADVKTNLLRDMISEKLLVQQANRLYDMKKLEESVLKNFKDSQNITSDVELDALLQQEGMTMADLKRKLVEYNAPRSVIDYEVRAKVVVTEAEVAAYYQDHAQDFATQEEVTFREIVFLSEGRGQEKAMALAKQAADELRGGADFEAMARDRSEAASKDRGGLLGPFHRGELNPDLEKVAFALAVGQVSDPIPTPYGAHLVRIESHPAAETPGIEKVRDKITATLEDERYARNLKTYEEKLWADADIFVRTSFLERVSPDYRRYVAAPPAESGVH